MRINIQILAYRQFRRSLNCLDIRIGLTDLAQLIDIRIKYCKTNMLSLFLCNHLGYTAYNLGTSSPKSY